MLFQNVPCIYKLSKMVIVWIASVNVHVSQGNSINSVFLRLRISFFLYACLCMCVCVCTRVHVVTKKYMVLASYAQMSSFGKEVKAAHCVQTLSSSSRLIADDSQDLPMNTRVLCVYTRVTYLSVLITSWQVV